MTFPQWAVAVLMTALIGATAPAPPPPPGISAQAADDEMLVTAVNAAGLIAQSEGANPAVVLDIYTRDDLCGVLGGIFMNSNCTGYREGIPLPDCEGLEPVPPVWLIHRDTPTSPWQQPVLALGWTCPQDAVPTFTETDFRRLPLTPQTITVQPDRPDVFVNMPTIVYTDPAVQAFATTLAGFPIEVEATPTTYTWDFGDGSAPIETTSPGHPYPDHDVAYPYPREGTFTITLTTTYSGRYRLAGSTTWLPVVGTAATTSTAGPLTPEEHETHLVHGNCFENPHGPYCDD